MRKTTAKKQKKGLEAIWTIAIVAIIIAAIGYGYVQYQKTSDKVTAAKATQLEDGRTVGEVVDNPTETFEKMVGGGSSSSSSGKTN